MHSYEAIREFLANTQVAGNTTGRWLAAGAVAVGVFLGLEIVRRVLIMRASAIGKARPSDWLESVIDLLRQTRVWFLLAMGLYAGSLALVLPAKPARMVVSAAILALLFQAALWGDSLVRFLVLRAARRRIETDGSGATTLATLGFLGRVAIWGLVVLLALANLGIDVTAMIAGLGIGGVAVALAAQNILGDLFASASIVLDKPFVLGDFIVVGDDMGTVEHIGLKTTRLRSISGEQLIFANNDLLKSRVRNFKRMNERRAVFSVGVTYQTTAECLAEIPAMLREIITAQSRVRFDRAHFKQFGESSLNFEVVYFVLSSEHRVYMDIQQAINLEIFRRFAAKGIEFAYPTRTLFVQSNSASG